MGIIFFAEIAIGVLVYLYKESVHDEVQKNLTKMISAYRDDEDLQDLIDWIQRDWVFSSSFIFKCFKASNQFLVEVLWRHNTRRLE